MNVHRHGYTHTHRTTHLTTSLTHLTDLQQERDTKRSKDLFVEMCNWNQHLIFLIQVDLVKRDFLTHKRKRLLNASRKEKKKQT